MFLLSTVQSSCEVSHISSYFDGFDVVLLLVSVIAGCSWLGFRRYDGNNKKWQFIRCRNMSIKPLQGCRESLQWHMYVCMLVSIHLYTLKLDVQTCDYVT